MSDSSSDDAARKERQRERSRRWREANAEKHKEQNRQWYQANRERIRAESRERYASDPAYREEVNSKNRQWQQANRSRVHERQRAWYEANRENVLERVRQYKEENREKYRENDARRYASNPEKWYASGIKYRHGLDDAGLAQMWAEQEGRCYLCRRELDLSSTRKAVVEHWHGCSGHDPKFSCSACRRGIACNTCNLIIGVVNDDPELLRIIASNLEAANRSVQERQLAAPEQLMLELE